MPSPASRPPAFPPIDPASLAPPSGRWTPSAKGAVMLALQRGQADEAAVRAALGLSAEELASWRRRWTRDQFDGLRETRLQRYRRPQARPEVGS